MTYFLENVGLIFGTIAALHVMGKGYTKMAVWIWTRA